MNTRALALTVALATAAALPVTAFFLHAHTNTPEYQAPVSYVTGAKQEDEYEALDYATPSLQLRDTDRGLVQRVALGPGGSPENAARRRAQPAAPRADEPGDYRGTADFSDESGHARAGHDGPASTPKQSAIENGSGPEGPQDYEDIPTIKEVQSFLKQRGYSVGAIDGINGPRTRGAIKAFETELGWNETGRLGIDLLIAVRARKDSISAFDRNQRVGGPINLVD
jgi:hypothetical protein